MPKLNDLTGQTFGLLKVVERAEDYVQPNGRHRPGWKCQCECGKTAMVLGENLTSGRSRSCGCYQKEYMSAHKSTHRETNTKLYGVWCSMKSRCYNPNVKYFKDYGGRGITVCQEWRESYESFRDWALSHGYKDGLSIDRIENDSGYSPGNCRWVTRAVQSNNRRSNNMLTLNGETHSISEWAKLLNVNSRRLYNRYYSGWDAEKILTI